jgi:CDP-diglyceride synthetase
MTLKKIAALWCGLVFGAVAAVVLASLFMFAIENPIPALIGFFILLTLAAFATLVNDA